MKNPALLIIGTSLEARAAADLIQLTGQIVYGFLYVHPGDGEGLPQEFNNIPVLGAVTDNEYLKVLQNVQTDYFIVEPNPNLRAPLLNKLFELTKKLPVNAVHPSVMIPESSELTSGNILPAGCMVGSEVQVQAMNYFSMGVILENGSRIGSFNTFQSGCIIGREVTIENNVFIGAGAVINSQIHIETGAIIAPGAIVLQNVPEGATVVGNPGVIKLEGK